MDNNEQYQGDSILSDLDQQRWLMNNGLFTTTSKNNLYVYGSLIHPSVSAVYLSIDVPERAVNYIVYLPKKTLKILDTYNRLKSDQSLVSLWRKRNILKKHGNLEFAQILTGFVRDYCGPKWSINLKIDNIDNYKDNLDDVEINAESRGDVQDKGSYR